VREEGTVKERGDSAVMHRENLGQLERGRRHEKEERLKWK